MENLTQLEYDILTLGAEVIEQKYSLEKKAIRDKKYNLNKKIKAAEMSTEDALKLPIKEDGEQVKQAAKKEGKVKSDDLFFTIDPTPPPFGVPEDRLKAIEKAKELAEEVAVDGAFFIPAKYKAPILTMLKKELSKFNFKPAKVSDKPDVLRIYKLKP
jgi:hypothetical protein